ncbi:unnamed protein product [Chilo suppressalis]|uniref:Uncharacterized protein n=1 Tax=Chilo suppressalis TaxID=168631 RepID=A0ABN8B6D2_CHISP|nr:unnamed protein product [Chilo suppressalis]
MEEKRKDIWNQSWSLDRQRRRDFLSRNVEKKPTLQVCRNGSRRHNTLLWMMENVKVCKNFFLETLGYKDYEVVRSVLSSNHLTNNKHPKVSAAPDMRGRKKPANSFPPDYESAITDFIMKYKPVQSHYNLQHAPNRMYLPPGVNFTLIFNQFKEHCTEKGLKVCSWTHFHSKIKSLNLSTAEMPQDICIKCRHNEMDHKNRPLPCNLANHLSNKRNSRKDLKTVEEKCKNSNGNEFVYTVDMQKVICMPLLNSKDYFFSRKLILFNESFVPPGKDKDAACVIWHEGESGRKVYNIASTYVYVLRK